jgi:hypothetical protein
MLIKGKNTDFVHRDERYHIQTESWAPDEEALVSQIFKSGKLILKKKHRILGAVKDLTEKDIDIAHNDAISEFKELLI